MADATYVYVVARSFESVDGPEIDVFSDSDAAAEHLRIAREVYGDDGAVLREEVVLTETYLPESEDE